MSAETAGVLREARGFIARGWCQGDYARSEFGNARPDSPTAQAWCPLGAIRAAVGLNAEYDAAVAAVKAAAAGLKRQVSGAISIWNDAPERTQAEVLAAFSKAIEAEEQSP